MQTAMVAEVPRGRVASLRFLLALLLLAWAMIMLWSRYSEISAWEAANDTSRATVAGIRSQQVFPWSLMSDKLSYSVVRHFDRVLPG